MCVSDVMCLGLRMRTPVCVGGILAGAGCRTRSSEWHLQSGRLSSPAELPLSASLTEEPWAPAGPQGKERKQQEAQAGGLRWGGGRPLHPRPLCLCSFLAHAGRARRPGTVGGLGPMCSPRRGLQDLQGSLIAWPQYTEGLLVHRVKAPSRELSSGWLARPRRLASPEAWIPSIIS